MAHTDKMIRAAFWRGGSSKGVFFTESDLPIACRNADRDAARRARDPILLSALGSPDPYGRQLNGMGGGLSSLSKAAIIAPSAREDADLSYDFAQVAVDAPVVDWGANCGNLSSAVGPYAVTAGLVKVADGPVRLRIHQVNTNKIIETRFEVAAGLPVSAGDFTIAGVAGSGACIALDFLDPGGSFAPSLLPGRGVSEWLETPDGAVEATLIDASNPMVLLRASDLGLTGCESPDAIEATPGLMARLDALRRAGGVRMGLGTTPEAVGLANPKIALLSAPQNFARLDGVEIAADAQDITVRMISMARAHRAVTLTAAMCIGAATRIPGTLAHALCRNGPAGAIRIANPSGILPVGAEVVNHGGWHVARTTAFRTARLLMQGEVAIRPQAFGDIT